MAGVPGPLSGLDSDRELDDELDSIDSMLAFDAMGLWEATLWFRGIDLA